MMNLAKVAKIGFTSTAIVISSGYVLLNGVFLDQYRLRKQFRSNDGEIVELNKQLIDEIDEVIEDLKISPSKKSLLQFFHTSERKIFSAGSLEFTNGVIIGIPYHFRYNSVEEINLNNIKLPETIQRIDWTSKHAIRLLDSLVLSPDARKFALASEAYFNDSMYLFFHTLVIAITTTLPQTIYDLVSKLKRAHLPSKPIGKQIGFYILAITFSIFQYIFLTDLLNIYYIRLSEKQAASMKKCKYLNGGVEYFQKQLQYNKAIRKLAKSGEHMFTKDGEEMRIRVRSPLAHKIKELRELEKKKLEKQQRKLIENVDGKKKKKSKSVDDILTVGKS